jgi:hypothetical protein
MKTKLALLLVICLSACGSVFAIQATTVESRKAFIKITEGDKHPGSPVDMDAPEVLYVRKADIIRVFVVNNVRSSEYRAFIVTAGPILGSQIAQEKVVMSNTSKVYSYSFSNEAAATAFCEAILAEQPAQ